MHIWNQEEYAVGVDIIDNQHKYLFSLVSEIYTTIIKNDKENLKLILMKLIYHTNLHFKTEIEYLLENGADTKEIVSHLNEHYNITNTLHEKVERYFLYGEDIMIDLALFINNWISDHIIEYDVEIFRKIKK
jgi:hemerythrin